MLSVWDTQKPCGLAAARKKHTDSLPEAHRWFGGSAGGGTQNLLAILSPCGLGLLVRVPAHASSPRFSLLEEVPGVAISYCSNIYNG